MHRTCKLDVEATYSAVACEIRARRVGRPFDFRLPIGLFPNVAKFQFCVVGFNARSVALA